MARLFDDVGTQYLEYSSAVISITPLTMACWFYIDDDGVNKAFTFMSLGDNAGGANYFTIQSNTFGGNVLQAVVNDGGGAGVASTTAGFTINTWHHACGVFISSTLRKIYIDGGNWGQSVVDRTPTVNETLIGVRHTFAEAYPFSGRLAEVPIWSAALADAEVAALAGGIPPWKIRPSALRGYWPLRFGRTWDRDILARGYHMVPVNGPTWAPHAPVAQRYWLVEDYRKWRKLGKVPAVGANVPQKWFHYAHH